MTSINVSVTGAALTAQAMGVLTSGMVGLPVRFAFDEAWEGLTKTAVFLAGGMSRDRVDIGEETTVPWEVMQKKNCTLYIGVYGVNEDGTLVMPTVWGQAGMIQPGADPAGDESTDPSLPVWQQMLQKATAAEKAAKAAEESAKKAADIQNEVFVAEYGVTTFAELEEAYNAGKAVFCRYGGYYLLPLYKYEAGNAVLFYRITKDEITNYHCTNNGWNHKTLQYAVMDRIADLEKRVAALETI